MLNTLDWSIKICMILKGKACYAFDKEYHIVRMYTRNVVEKRSIIPEQIHRLAHTIFNFGEMSFSQLQYLRIWSLGSETAKTLKDVCPILGIEELVVPAPMPLPADKADYGPVRALVDDQPHLIKAEQQASHAAAAPPTDQSVQSRNNISPFPLPAVSTNPDNQMKPHQQTYSHPLSGKIQFGAHQYGESPNTVGYLKVHQNDSNSDMVELSLMVNDKPPNVSSLNFYFAMICFTCNL